jgi:transcriptional regulator with XRE-family HTH domain
MARQKVRQPRTGAPRKEKVPVWDRLLPEAPDETRADKPVPEGTYSAKLLRRMRELGVDVKELCRLTGLVPNTVYRYIKNEVIPQGVEMILVAEAMGVTIGPFHPDEGAPIPGRDSIVSGDIVAVECLVDECFDDESADIVGADWIDGTEGGGEDDSGE